MASRQRSRPPTDCLVPILSYPVPVMSQHHPQSWKSSRFTARLCRTATVQCTVLVRPILRLKKRTVTPNNTWWPSLRLANGKRWRGRSEQPVRPGVADLPVLQLHLRWHRGLLRQRGQRRYHPDSAHPTPRCARSFRLLLLSVAWPQSLLPSTSPKQPWPSRLGLLAWCTIAHREGTMRQGGGGGGRPLGRPQTSAFARRRQLQCHGPTSSNSYFPLFHARLLQPCFR